MTKMDLRATVSLSIFTASLLFTMPVFANPDQIDGTQVDNAFLGDAGGVDGATTHQNQLWGDWFVIDDANNFAQGDNLVHVEADDDLADNPTGYTFYRRYMSQSTGGDNREPLATTWGTRYLPQTGEGWNQLTVWRDSYGSDPIARETGDSTGIFRETGDSTGIFRETGDSTGIFRETGDSTGIFRETGDSTGIFPEGGASGLSEQAIARGYVTVDNVNNTATTFSNPDLGETGDSTGVFSPLGEAILVQVDTTIAEPAGNTVDPGNDEARTTAN